MTDSFTLLDVLEINDKSISNLYRRVIRTCKFFNLHPTAVKR